MLNFWDILVQKIDSWFQEVFHRSTKGVRSYDSKLRKNPDVVVPFLLVIFVGTWKTVIAANFHQVKTTQTSNPVAFKKWYEFLCLCWFVVFSKSIHNTSNLNFQLGLDGCLPESSKLNKCNSKTGLLQNETFFAGIFDEPYLDVRKISKFLVTGI